MNVQQHPQYPVNATAARHWYQKPGPIGALAAGLGLATGLVLGVPATFGIESALAAVAEQGSTVQQAPGYQAGVGTGQPGTGRSGVQGADGSAGPGSSDGLGDGAGGARQVPGGQDSAGEAGTGTASGQAAATSATAKQAAGVVIINTNLKYEGAAGAGTGMVVKSDGTVLTNNHVIAGATSIKVTVPASEKTYTATVVGTQAQDDVAVLKLTGAKDLATVALDEDQEKVGQAITAVGNAQGRGELAAARGTITALDSTVTTESEGTVGSESLDGMIEISARVVSGDSGGALLDDEGEVVGMNTAASSGSSTITAYAIPIEDAMSIADRITAGDESAGVSLGYPAFLGVQVAAADQDSAGAEGSAGGVASGAPVAGVIAGTAAAKAGLEEGDLVTSVGGTRIASPTALTKALSGYDPGQRVKIEWTDSAGASHAATVTLTQGPAS
ncbi:S1C family serine protease [Brevibacterium sp. 91QC2O2]|uniref:S1C family serine protease n=1 Tax=Brevibacterium sp. 91QC2O2 TaxID=2968458 RepID=UPI00211C0274|nr:S1C family serine protease [Brevibacterium sp. 91QC2O2]MCQ9368315.1 S1C family serine protease [Brevibacterium sp. 91QC2O2]